MKEVHLLCTTDTNFLGELKTDFYLFLQNFRLSSNILFLKCSLKCSCWSVCVCSDVERIKHSLCSEWRKTGSATLPLFSVTYLEKEEGKWCVWFWVTGLFLPFCSTCSPPSSSATASLVKTSAFSKVFRPGWQTQIRFDDTCGPSQTWCVCITDHSEFQLQQLFQVPWCWEGCWPHLLWN